MKKSITSLFALVLCFLILTACTQDALKAHWENDPNKIAFATLLEKGIYCIAEDHGIEIDNVSIKCTEGWGSYDIIKEKKLADGKKAYTYTLEFEMPEDPDEGLMQHKFYMVLNVKECTLSAEGMTETEGIGTDSQYSYESSKDETESRIIEFLKACD